MHHKLHRIFGNTKHLARHELRTINYFANRGYTIFIIPLSTIKTPDITINDTAWEMKYLTSASRRTIEHAFSTAAKQCPHVIFDLRGIKNPAAATNAIRTLKRSLAHSKRVTKIKIITKDNRLLELEKS